MEGNNAGETTKPCGRFRDDGGGVDTAEGVCVWEGCTRVSAGVSKSHKCMYGGLQHDVVRDEDKDEDEEDE